MGRKITGQIVTIALLLGAGAGWAGTISGTVSAKGSVDYADGPCQDGFDSYCATDWCACISLTGTLVEGSHRYPLQINASEDLDAEIAGCRPMYAQEFDSDTGQEVGVSMILGCGKIDDQTTGTVTLQGGQTIFPFTGTGPSYNGRVSGSAIFGVGDSVTVHGSFTAQ